MLPSKHAGGHLHPNRLQMALAKKGLCVVGDQAPGGAGI